MAKAPADVCRPKLGANTVCRNWPSYDAESIEEDELRQHFPSCISPYQQAVCIANACEAVPNGEMITTFPRTQLSS
jgi:hypothetical protein